MCYDEKMKKIAVVIASKHGATLEIGDFLVRKLQSKKLLAKLFAVEIALSVDFTNYDAFVIGSAVYGGFWMKTATEFVKQNQQLLSQKKVWLFSSGPLGEPPVPSFDHVVSIAQIEKLITPVKHCIFSGKLDKNNLSFTEKALIKLVGASYGDYRPWDMIEKWGKEIRASV